jgi:anti-sigma regulatory factor (Ser/Thr protein kinase)
VDNSLTLADIAPKAYGYDAPGVSAHTALLYSDDEEFLAGVGAFLEAGLEAGEPVMAAVPARRFEPLRDRFGESVRLVDMGELGRNPGRIIPAVRDWLDGHGQIPARFVGEPLWPGRSAAEAAEGLRHEALLNLAFAGDLISILCPYDTAHLDPDVVDDAGLTHALLECEGHTTDSARYADPETVYAATDRELSAPVGPVSRLPVTEDLAALRAFVAERTSGLDDDRRFDLLLAVNEAAVNTFVHGDGHGVLRMWRDNGDLVCELSDGGASIADPLVGRRRPDPRTSTGRGLWMINQICDLVELRPGRSGTTVRLHMSLS